MATMINNITSLTISDIGELFFVISPLILVILFYLRFKDSKFR